MDNSWEQIRKYSMFMFMFTLNARFLYDNFNPGKPMYILEVLYVGLALLAFDYKTLTREYIVVVFSVLLIGIVGGSSFVVGVLVILLLMQCAYCLDTKTYLKYNIILLGISSILMFVNFGIGENVFDDIDLFDRSERFSFGFFHPNQAAYYYYGLFISIILYVANDAKTKKILPLCLIIISFLVYYIYEHTISRSFIMSVAVFVVVVLYYSLRIKINSDYKIKYSKYILIALPLIFFLVTIYFGFNYDEYPLLNILFSGRPFYYNAALMLMKPSNYVLGLGSIDEDLLVLDSFYMHLIVEVGVLLLLYFLWLYYHAMKNMVAQQNIYLIATIVSILCYGLMESSMLTSTVIGINLIWVLIYKYRYNADPYFDPPSEDLENVKRCEISDSLVLKEND